MSAVDAVVLAHCGHLTGAAGFPACMHACMYGVKYDACWTLSCSWRYTRTGQVRIRRCCRFKSAAGGPLTLLLEFHVPACMHACMHDSRSTCPAVATN